MSTINDEWISTARIIDSDFNLMLFLQGFANIDISGVLLDSLWYESSEAGPILRKLWALSTAEN